MRQEGCRAGEHRTISHRKADTTARDCTPIWEPATLPLAGAHRSARAPLAPPSASGTALSLRELSPRPPAPGPACGAFGEGHSPGRPATSKAAAGRRRAGGRGRRRVLRGRGVPASGAGRASWAETKRGWGSGLVSSSPLPPGRDRDPEGRRLAGDSTSLCRRPCRLGIAVAPILAVGTAV